MLAVLAFGPVQHEYHVLELLFRVVAVDDGQHVALKQAATNDEQRLVGQSGNDVRVGNDVDGGTVDKDVVIMLFELFKQLAESAV